MKNLTTAFCVASFSLLSVASAEKPAAADTTAPTVCYSNDDCAHDQFCNIEGKASNMCGGAGVCAARGISLMCMMIDVRACGCDGKPYANGCLAHKAGVSLDPVPFKPASIDGDTLAEQPWMDGAQSNFYLFTGDGTAENQSGTFEQRFEPACTRATPIHCMIATTRKTGSFYTWGSIVELDYDNGDVAFFDAQVDCHGTWQLVSEDQTATTLVVSTITP